MAIATDTLALGILVIEDSDMILNYGIEITKFRLQDLDFRQ
jgi:hypothetical protein